MMIIITKVMIVMKKLAVLRVKVTVMRADGIYFLFADVS